MVAVLYDCESPSEIQMRLLLRFPDSVGPDARAPAIHAGENAGNTPVIQ